MRHFPFDGFGRFARQIRLGRVADSRALDLGDVVAGHVLRPDGQCHHHDGIWREAIEERVDMIPGFALCGHVSDRWCATQPLHGDNRVGQTIEPPRRGIAIRSGHAQR